LIDLYLVSIDIALYLLYHPYFFPVSLSRLEDCLLDWCKAGVTANMWSCSKPNAECVCAGHLRELLDVFWDILGFV